MQRFIRFVIPVVIVFLAWLLWPFLQSASGQVTRMQETLIKAAAKRNWMEVKELMASDFQGMWELDREEATAEATEYFQGFLYLNIDWTTAEVTVNGEIAKVRGTMKMNGSGAGPSQMIMNRVNALKEPWVFTWRKEGWKPKSWKLVSVTNQEIVSELPDR